MLDVQPDLKAIFCEALEKESPEGIAAYLDDACAGDPESRERVEALIRADQDAGRFLGGSPLSADATVDAGSIGEGPGAQVGPYRLIEHLGEGAFGVVYSAEQRDTLRRCVALKIIKPGMDSKEIIARFEAERQALAVMNHPNIARVFGAGATASGRPFFAMELVDGLPITDYCDRKNLTTDMRLELFVGVCQAVQHAHQKGIIHRDLKPSNILVAEEDDKPVAKVIDFGIAKAIHSPLTEHTLVTGRGQVLGTPLYMSPEQADPKCSDVDTRSDIYSLGVVLYELLTGSTPVEKSRLRNITPDEFSHIICEEEPPRPSTRIGALGDTAREICKHRNTEPKKLSALIRRDLDWIVMKCLEKDRTRRYETASALARDIQRHLGHQPVEATPPSLFYSVQKFTRRNRRWIRGTMYATLLLSVAAAGAWRLHREVVGNRGSQLKATAVKEIQEAGRLVEEGDIVKAFGLLSHAEEVLPGDYQLQTLMPQVSSRWNIEVNPRDAVVSILALGQGDEAWRRLADWPCDLPRVEHLWRVERDGYVTATGCSGPGDVNRQIELIEDAGDASDGMACVTHSDSNGQTWRVIFDVCEITNEQYAAFIADGGYENEKYWQHLIPYRIDEEEVGFEELVATFRDKTGRPGPGHWENGTFPEGEEEHPVRSICWYEASAYAKWAGRSLPTVHDWERAACLDQTESLAFRSNLGGKGTMPVGRPETLNGAGLHDMAGNVKEWCLNAAVDGFRTIRGGGWQDHIYVFQTIEIASPWCRAEDVGFRCVSYPQSPPKKESEPIAVNSPTAPPPVEKLSLEEFERIRKIFLVDAETPLNTKSIRVNETDTYRDEVIEVDTAYGNDRFQIHMLLPKTPRKVGEMLRPIVYHPGNGVKKTNRFRTDHGDFTIATRLVESGRAVCFPVYNGTFERSPAHWAADTSQKRRELAIQGTQDLIQAVNYLATRPDMDLDSLTYLGWSWGGNVATRMVTVENRFKACVIMGGGLQMGSCTELDGRTFAPYVDIPVLMLGGRMDTIVSFKARQIPLLDALEATDDKDLLAFDSHHGVPLDEALPKVKAWIDERFPPVPPSPENGTNWLKRVTEMMMEQKRYKEAGEYYDQLISLLTKQKGANHRETLYAVRMKSRALRLGGQGDKGIPMLKRCLERYVELLGAQDEDTLVAASEYAGVNGWIARNACKRADRERETYERALGVAEIAVDTAERFDLSSSPYLKYTKALVYYRLKRFEDCWAILNEAFDEEVSHTDAAMLWALCHEAAGRRQAAEDWYAATCELIAKHQWGASTLHRETASVLQLPVSWERKELDREEDVELYTRLIAEKPEVALFYYARGSHRGRMGDWPRAKADYDRAHELAPDDHRIHEAAIALALCHGTEEERLRAARDFLERAREKLNMDHVLMCSLVSLSEDEKLEVGQMADEVLSKTPTRFFLELAKGMALYRLERYKDALAILPHGSYIDPKNEVLAVLFRAMTHYQLGDAYTCRLLLAEAHEKIEEQIPSPEGSLLKWQDRPVVWCMVHTALREAEALIGSDRLSPQDTEGEASIGVPRSPIADAPEIGVGDSVDVPVRRSIDLVPSGLDPLLPLDRLITLGSLFVGNEAVAESLTAWQRSSGSVE